MNFLSFEYTFVNFSRKTGRLRARNRQYRVLNFSPCLFVCYCKVVDHFAEPRVHILVIANVSSDACHTILDHVTPCQEHLAVGVELSRLVLHHGVEHLFLIFCKGLISCSVHGLELLFCDTEERGACFEAAQELLQ